MTITSNSSESRTPGIRTLLHPSDFSEASLVAFAHALKVALIFKSKLVPQRARPTTRAVSAPRDSRVVSCSDV
jgi:hypothetical protein